ncbi:MAG: cell division protein ZapA [Halanaerobiales bacterium]|nr:cell division protein ZapA [Halanaerobiales bacterium]
MSLENKNSRSSAEVNIFGETLQIKGKSSVDYMKSVARFVDEKMYELNHNYPRMSRNKIIALGAMNIADELIKAKEEIELLKKGLEKVQKEKEELELAYDRSQKLMQHYQSEYEEIALLLEEVD